MLEKILLLIGADADQELVNLLISNAKAFLLLYCGFSEYSSAYDAIVIKMVVEDYNRLGSEGLSSKSFSGLSETFSDTAYSPLVMSMLNMAKSQGSAGRIRLL